MALHIPLPVLLALVVVGVSLSAGLIHWVGWSAEAVLDEAAVRRLLALDAPDEAVLDVALATDQRSALVSLETGSAVVFVLGDRLVSRRLPEAVRIETYPERLRLRLPDPGCPRIDVRLHPDVCQHWLARLQ